MTDGDSAELATELGITATWYEIGLGNDSSIVVDSAEAERAAKILAGDSLVKGRDFITLKSISGDPCRTTAGTISYVIAVTPEYRRQRFARELLGEREEKAFRAENKKFGDDDDD